ncbi:MAG: hypothetical protein DME21_05845, partial [Verrucomicrobia bacterium]
SILLAEDNPNDVELGQSGQGQLHVVRVIFRQQNASELFHVVQLLFHEFNRSQETDATTSI